MFRNTTIGARLWLLTIVTNLLLLIVGGVGWLGMSRSNDATRQVYQQQLAAATYLAEARSNQLLVRVLLDQAAFATDPADAKARAATAQDFARQSDAAWKSYLEIPRNEEQTRATEAVSARRQALFTQGVAPMIAALHAGNRDAMMTAVMDTIPKLDIQFTAVNTELARLQVASAKAVYESSQDRYGRLLTLSLVVLAVGLVFSTVVAWRLRVSIVRPLDVAIARFARIADGDLGTAHREDAGVMVDEHARNETSRMLGMLGRMQARLREMVGEVRGGADSIAAASAQIASGNANLSQRTEQQAASLEETASSMEQLTSTVRHNADSARDATSLATNAQTLAERGSTAVSRVVDTMRAIDAGANKIVDIIEVIEKIAFQTNILALNAAVEAARAGEHGRGFAVVAGDVRDLSQRCAAASKEIRGLIGASVSSVREGTSLVDGAGRAMQDIVDEVRRVSDIIGGISAASDEQSRGIEQVNVAVSHMDGMTQQNAALVEEAAAAAASLQDQAQRLTGLMAAFRLA
ncbi:methyl-accepting chemotaxis sensory transducer with TarH sensor [Cupriavidus sp. OV038]|jgi:methyl-accepting chemotaxis protein-1 (serine sensor receptor)|uniref:methyl-accepting chemotaxis protein n=1 Tax=unclassified Cupriavidus TaxID=2640874 RepID=UPI0008F1BBF6|nr:MULTISPECIES: methyl-accepting chemotaxis protein [unclassified Cupriavidus]SFB69201.1 methyl-accepting chemotaxis sensory transducer with TarH sensor [Cupriavidus sp. OV038]SFO58632.1 methyl-accepting chemotaxis sensory transducer with TarH sensor [Cupriavidus sp. OV096]